MGFIQTPGPSLSFLEEKMGIYRPWRNVYVVLVPAALGLVASTIARDLPSKPSQPEAAREVLAQKLPEMNGKNLEIKVIEVKYAPGAGSAPHTHGCPLWRTWRKVRFNRK
jgi:hypothetical protein